MPVAERVPLLDQEPIWSKEFVPAMSKRAVLPESRERLFTKR